MKPLPLLIAAVWVAAALPAGAQSLRGSRSSVELIFSQAVSHDLHFYESSAGVRQAARSGVFVRLEGNADYRVNFGVSHPYVLPTTRTFVQRLAAQYRAACGERLVVTSGVRPMSLRLANGSDKSVHPTGMAVDLRKPGGRCLAWLRSTLVELEGAGAIDAVEERRPPHFHVAVFPEPYRRHVQREGGAPVLLASAAEAPSRTSGAKPATAPGKQAKAAAPKASAAAQPRTYRVRPGDTLWTIARQNRLSVDSIKRANELRSSRIKVGQRLRLPREAK